VTTLEEAIKTKNAYRKHLKLDGRPAWLLGVGVACYQRDFCIMVNVMAPEDEKRVLTSFEGVRVVVQVQGDIRAQEPS